MKKRVYANASAKTEDKKVVKKRRMYIPKTLSVREKSHRVTLLYTDVYTLNPGVSGNVVVQVFAANGPYDPDITGAGHQPARFDQYMTVYGEYVVVASRIKCVFTNTNYSTVSGTDVNGIVGVSVNQSSTAQTDWRRYVENGDTNWTCISQSGGEPKTLMAGADVKKYYRQDIYNDSDFAGTDSSNPQEILYYHVWARSVQGTDTGAFNVTVQIEYDVYFKEPNNVALS